MIKHYFIIALSVIFGSALNAQNRYDFTDDPRNDDRDKDSLRVTSRYEIGYTFSPYSLNQTQLIFDASELIYQDIDELIESRSANLHSFFFGANGYVGKSKNTVIHIGINLHTARQLNFLNSEISVGRSWKLTPFDNPNFRFNANLGIQVNSVGFNLENNPDDAGLSQNNVGAIASMDFHIPIYKQFCFFVRGTAALPVYTWKRISFPIEETLDGTRFDTFDPNKNGDILSIEPNGNRFFNSFFFITTGISFNFK
jgi:hypothetical protein